MNALGHQTTNVAKENGRKTVMEQGEADAQQLRFIDLDERGSPSELVSAVTPNGATNQNDLVQHRAERPQQDVNNTRIGYSLCSMSCVLRSSTYTCCLPQGIKLVRTAEARWSS